MQISLFNLHFALLFLHNSKVAYYVSWSLDPKKSLRKTSLRHINYITAHVHQRYQLLHWMLHKQKIQSKCWNYNISKQQHKLAMTFGWTWAFHKLDLLISLLSWWECRELSGKVNWPLCMARGLSPNGRVKKHSLYKIQPSAYRYIKNKQMSMKRASALLPDMLLCFKKKTWIALK